MRVMRVMRLMRLLLPCMPDPFPFRGDQKINHSAGIAPRSNVKWRLAGHEQRATRISTGRQQNLNCRRRPRLCRKVERRPSQRRRSFDISIIMKNGKKKQKKKTKQKKKRGAQSANE
jgi:hypothetical protein